MSLVGKLKFFLEFQIKQIKDGIFLSQTKYSKDLVNKFSLKNTSPSRTPISTTLKLHQDPSRKKVKNLYMSMIGSLLYLKTSCIDISFSVEVCTRYQASPKESHLVAIKRIIKYIKGTLEFGIWYPQDTTIKLVG